MARNRYGWEKRAKEMARKQKNDEKMKRRQGKTETALAEENPEVVEDLSLNETDPAGIGIPQDS
jgi:hypothetical protein